MKSKVRLDPKVVLQGTDTVKGAGTSRVRRHAEATGTVYYQLVHTSARSEAVL